MLWLRKLTRALRPHPPAIDDALWQTTLQDYPFLGMLGDPDRQRLRTLCHLFLQHKEFHGVGLAVTDAMALAIAAQACRPLLHLHARPQRALAWYDDFVGINIYPGDMRARRKTQDAAGVVHHYHEDLAGEAMQDGPVTLSWASVQAGGQAGAEGHNLVIHEFAHKLDMRDGVADGCPPLPGKALRKRWQDTLQAQYLGFCDALQLAERFGAAPPFLDDYAATGLEEFFAVACEAYFVNRAALAMAHAELPPLFDQFFLQGQPG